MLLFRMANKFLLRLFSLICFELMRDSESLQTYTLQACYGNGFEDFLSPTCPSGSTIYVYDVYTYSKRKDRNCPTIADQTNRNITYCCNYVNETEDCGKRYYGTAAPYEHEHYSRCSGRQTCIPGVQASWNSTDDVCDSAIFMERSNYMKMWYNCLPDSGLVSISNTTLTAQSIYLSSEGYPLEMPSCDSTSGSACTVSSSGVSTIRITGFDLQFSERSGECKQRLLITDGSLISDVACDDVNNFARSVLYTSQSTRIELRLDNADTSTGGKFWIHLEATDLAEQITIECQHRSPEVSCNETFTIISPDTVTTGTTTSRTTLIPSPTAAGASSPDDVITTRISGTSPSNARYASISSIVTTNNVTTGTQSNLNTTVSYRKSQRTNDSQDSGDSALVYIPVILLVLVAAAGFISYLYWKHKKKKANKVVDQTLDPALQSHLPVITSLPPSVSTPVAWNGHGANTDNKSNKYEKEPTLFSLKIN